MFGLPSLRVKGLYLAIATLAAQFMLDFVFREWESVTGGVRGANVPAASVFGFELEQRRPLYYLIVSLRRRAARRRRATCSAPASAAPSSRSATATSRPRSSASACCATSCSRSRSARSTPASPAGCSAYFFRVVTPERFPLSLSIFFLAAIIVGGLGTDPRQHPRRGLHDPGAGGAAAVVGWARPLGCPDATVLLAPVRQVVFGVLIVGFLIFEPHGLAEIWRRIRRLPPLAVPDLSIRLRTARKEMTMSVFDRRKLDQAPASPRSRALAARSAHRCAVRAEAATS